MPGFKVFRGVTRGFGGSASALITSSFSIQAVVNAIADAVRGDGAPLEFDDGITIYSISAALQEINRSPLNNPLYHKITKLIIEKKIKINADLTSQITHKSDPYKIVISGHRVVNETNE